MIANMSEKHAKGKTKYYGKIENSPENELLFIASVKWTYIRHKKETVSIYPGTLTIPEIWSNDGFTFKDFETRKPGTVFTFTQL